MTIWKYLFHPLTFAIVAGVITYVLMRLDCKVSNEDKKTSTYCKNIVFVSALVGGVSYFISKYGLTGDTKQRGGGDFNLSIDDVKLGEPDF